MYRYEEVHVWDLSAGVDEPVLAGTVPEVGLYKLNSICPRFNTKPVASVTP